MTDKREMGRRGEGLAADFLVKRGYRLLCRNYTVRGGELDIVAQKDGFLVFAEVKLRRDARFGAPRCAIDQKKKRNMLCAAERFLYEQRENDALCALQPRFDCLEVILTPRTSVTHIVNIDMN